MGKGQKDISKLTISLGKLLVNNVNELIIEKIDDISYLITCTLHDNIKIFYTMIIVDNRLKLFNNEQTEVYL